MRQYASPSHIRGWIHENGGFAMNCFGDACDLSVYPDLFHGERSKTVELGCHNLDRADQQLTLLAGLAQMCQLVREGTNE